MASTCSVPGLDASTIGHKAMAVTAIQGRLLLQCRTDQQMSIIVQ